MMSTWTGLLFLAAVAVTTVASASPRWLRASTPDLTMVTTLDEKSAVARVNEFTQYIAALRAYLGNEHGPLSPLTMVVFARRADFDRYRPLGKDGKPQWVGGFFVPRDSWAIVGVDANLSREIRHRIYHEGVHWYLHGSETGLPPWLDEGMAEVFSTFEIAGKDARWGRAIDRHVDRLHEYGPMPMRHLMRMRRDDLFGGNSYDTNLFYSQSWAFVHFLIFGESGISRDAAYRYVALVKSGVAMEQAFSQAFGRSYHEMDLQFSRYLDGGKYRLSRRPLAVVPPVRVEPALPQEIDEALGRLALVGHRYGLAIEHGRAMVARDPADARGRTLLGESLKENGQENAAADEFRLAAQLGSKDYEPYFEAGYALQKTETAGGGTLSEGDARRVADYYEQALVLRPGFEVGYENLASVIGLAEPLLRKDASVLAQGRAMFPDNVMIQLGQAQIARRGGDVTGSRKELERILAQSGAASAKVVTFATQIRTAWATQDFFNGISVLIAARKYDEALQLLDGKEGETLAAAKMQAESLRREIRAAAAMQRLNRALNEQRWDAAREIIDHVLASDAPPGAKNEAKRLLADLEHRKTGPEEATP